MPNFMSGRTAPERREEKEEREKNIAWRYRAVCKKKVKRKLVKEGKAEYGGSTLPKDTVSSGHSVMPATLKGSARSLFRQITLRANGHRKMASAIDSPKSLNFLEEETEREREIY